MMILIHWTSPKLKFFFKSYRLKENETGQIGREDLQLIYLMKKFRLPHSRNLKTELKIKAATWITKRAKFCTASVDSEDRVALRVPGQLPSGRS